MISKRLQLSRVIAHRGACAQAPENTIVAMRKAQVLGARWVEVDVQLTKCGQVVVIHDEKINRTSNGKGFINELTYAELKLLDFGAWFGDAFINTRISTLNEILDFIFAHGMKINIEIKPYLDNEFALTEQVIAIVNQYPALFLDSILLSSFSFNVLKYTRELHNEVAIGLLMDDWFVDWQNMADEVAATTVNVNREILDEKRAQEILQTQRQILVYTVNDVAMAKDLFSLGVTSVFSDCPVAMEELL